jgi:hypothetical protein
VLELICLIIGVSFYYSLVGLRHGSFLDSVQSNLLPGPLVLAMLGSVLLMTIDRALYITSSSRLKLGFHCLLAVAFHICYIIWRDVPNTNVPAGIAYFVVKEVYFTLSCYQIRAGYPMFRKHDPFKEHHDDLFGLLYYVYRSIPFLWELRVLLDWTFTRTTLKFTYWVKLEDVMNAIFMRQIDEASLGPPGTPIPIFKKVLQGGLLYVILVVLLFFPLLIYSTFNPSLVANYMTDVEVTASFGTLSTWYHAGLLEAETLSPGFIDYLDHARPNIGALSEGDGRSIQILTMPECSASAWDTSPSALQALNNAFNATFRNMSSLNVRLRFEFTRRYFAQAQNSAKSETIDVEVPVSAASAGELLEFTTGNQSHVVVPISDFYMPYVLNKPDRVYFFEDQGEKDQALCQLNFSLSYDPVLQSHIRYTCLECSGIFYGGNRPSPAYPDWNCIEYGTNCSNWYSGLLPAVGNMFFYVISDMVPNDKGLLPNVGIIALYTTFILAIGQVLRGALAGSAFRTGLEDMQDPHRVDDLVESILLCQASGRREDLELEALLYYELIDLLRSSEAMLTVTGSRAEAYRHKVKAA